MPISDQMLITLSANPGEASWHQLMPEGVFKHPRYGKLDFRSDFFAEVVQNFDDRVRGQDIPIDLMHRNEEAGGWLKSLQYRPGDGLWGLVEWTSLGIEKVGNKLLRYFSAQLGPHTDERTGKEHKNTLIALTLTNFPFLKGQNGLEIQLSELTDETADEAQEEVQIFSEAIELAAPVEDGGPSDAKDCPICGKPWPDCTCDLSKLTPAQLATRSAEMKKDGVGADPKKKGGTVRSNTPEGAYQPSKMRGAKPTITRGRSPDPSSEASHMSENPTADTTENADTVSLEEMKGVTARLTEQVTKLSADYAAAQERIALSEKVLLERDISDEVRSFSEGGTFMVGETAVTAKYAVPSVVTAMYREYALSEPAKRDSVRAIIAKLQEVGMLALSTKGVGHDGSQNDPAATPAGLTPDQKIFAKAAELALSDGKEFGLGMDLSEQTLYSLRAEAVLKANKLID